MTQHQETIEIIKNQNREKITFKELRQKSALFKKTFIDIGAGDCKFIYSYAKKNPDTFCIAIDANADQMKFASWKVCRKPAKGGLEVDNLLFIPSLAEEIPDELAELADEITINYPWGSLLRGVIDPDSVVMEKIVNIAKGGSTISILINFYIFKDKEYVRKLGLPDLDFAYIEKIIVPFYKKLSLDVKEYKISDQTNGTLWSNRLTLGESKRDTLWIDCRVNRV